jgi:hypothetical protein
MGRLFTKMLSTYSDRSITGLDHIVIFTDTRSAPSYEFLEISFNLAPDAHFCAKSDTARGEAS